jgi:serine/threonine protein kinase
LEDREDFKWEKRLNCALDAAMGLSHLHGSNPQIFHRDVKSQNIILDRYGTAKVADFGLALLAENNQHSMQILEKSRPGTLGYADPNYIRSGVVTEKADVYSAGMVILELLTGRPPAWNNSSGKVEYIIDHIKGLQDVIAMIDRQAGFPYKMVQRVGNLALRAIHEKQQNRPTFAEMVTDIRTWLSDTSLRGAALLGAPERECVMEQYCSHVDLSPAHAQSSNTSNQQFSFSQPPNCGTQASAGFVDEDGDSIRFAVEDGKLIRYVNGRKLVGENDSSGIVESLTYQPSRPASVRDQYGWGSEDFPLKVVSELRYLADSVGVPNNLPKANGEPEQIDVPQYARILEVRAEKVKASQAPTRLECEMQADALQQKWMQEMTFMLEAIEKENADLRSTISLLEKNTAGNSDLERSLMARLARSEERKQELELSHADLMRQLSSVEERNANLIIRMSSSEQRRQELEQENAELQKRVQALDSDRAPCRPPETRSGHQHDTQRQQMEEVQALLQSQLQASQYRIKQAEDAANALRAEKEAMSRSIRDLQEELWLAGKCENGQAPEIASDGMQSDALSSVSSSGESVQLSQVIRLSSSDFLDSPPKQDHSIHGLGGVSKQISKDVHATSMIVGMSSPSVKTMSPSTGDCITAGAKRILPNTRRGLLVLRTEPPGQEL